MYEIVYKATHRFFGIDEMYILVMDEMYEIVWIWIFWNWLKFDQFWKFKFHFKHFLRNTRFPSFRGPTNYFHLFKNHQQTFRNQGNVRHSTSKLLKCDLAQTLNTFWNHSLRIVAADKASLVLIESLLFGDTFFNQFDDNRIRNATTDLQFHQKDWWHSFYSD